MHQEFVKDFITKNYDLGKVFGVEPFYGGLQNYTAKVETERGIFTVKLFTKGREKRDRIQSTLQLLGRLSEKRLKVHAVICAVDDKLMVPIERSDFHHAGAVLSYLEGEILSREEVTSRHIGQASRYLGEIHCEFKQMEVEDLELPDSPEVSSQIEEFSGMIRHRLDRNYLELSAGELRQVRYWWKKTEEWLTRVKRINFRKDELIHTDYSRVNILFKDGELSGVLDFDACRFGDRREDIANSIWMWYEHQEQGLTLLGVREIVETSYIQAESGTKLHAGELERLAMLEAWSKLNWYIEEPRNKGEADYHRHAYWNIREPLEKALLSVEIID